MQEDFAVWQGHRFRAILEIRRKTRRGFPLPFSEFDHPSHEHREGQEGRPWRKKPDTLATKKTAKKAESSQETPAAVLEAAPADEQIVPENDDALIAAITAAISLMLEDKQTGFIVRRVRRIQNSTAFARAARDEQLYNHL